jgi:hypothetical protein
LEAREYSFDSTDLGFDESFISWVIPSVDGSMTSPSVSSIRNSRLDANYTISAAYNHKHGRKYLKQNIHFKKYNHGHIIIITIAKYMN